MSFLVIQAARFGDLVQTGRLLRSLAARGEVHLAVDSVLEPLARILYPFAIPHALTLHRRPDAAALEANRNILARFRQMRFDAVYNCNFSGLTAALCRIFPRECVHGYRPDGIRVARSPWVRLGFRLSEQRACSPLNLVDFWAHFVADPLAPAEVNPPARPGGQGLGVVLAGRETRRSLPPPVLAEITRTASDALHGPRIYLFGTAAEQPLARRLRHALPTRLHDRLVDLCGRTDWSALVETLRGLDALLTPDTGTMHLAARLGVPVLAFFLSSAALHETGPYGQGHYVWQSCRTCAPCLESAPCPHDTACATPFGGDALLRSVALVAGKVSGTGNPGDTGHPEPHNAAHLLDQDIQLWRTDTDMLGARPLLCAGTDRLAERRAAVRIFLAARLRIPIPKHNPLWSLAESEMPAVEQWLCHNDDWMLSPGRYC